MKKAKFLIYAALAASTVAISSCSDNDVLSEPANEPEGKALIVNPTVEGSRIATTGSGDFKSFKLFGFQNPPATQSQSLFFNGTEGYVDHSAGPFYVQKRTKNLLSNVGRFPQKGPIIPTKNTV